MRLHLVAPVGLVSGLLHTPPVFEICAFHSREQAGIFRRIFYKFGPESGKFMKELWGPSNRNSGRILTLDPLLQKAYTTVLRSSGRQGDMQ